jgi:hypothetical protein
MKLWKAIKRSFAWIVCRYHQFWMEVYVEETYNAASEEDQMYWCKLYDKHKKKYKKYISVINEN